MNLTAAHPKDDCSIARHAHRGVWCHIDCTALLIGMTVTDYSTLDAQFAAFGTDGSAARRRTVLDHGLVLQRDQRTRCRAVVTRFNGSAAFHAGEVPYCTALKGKTAILDDDTVRLVGFTRINSAAVVTLIIIRLGLVVLNRQGTAALIDDLFPVWRQNMPVQIQLHIGSGLIDADRLFLVYQKMDRLALLRRVDGSLQGRIEEIAVRVGERIIGTVDPCYRFPCNILLQCRGQEMLRQFGVSDVQDVCQIGAVIGIVPGVILVRHAHVLGLEEAEIMRRRRDVDIICPRGGTGIGIDFAGGQGRRCSSRLTGKVDAAAPSVDRVVGDHDTAVFIGHADL